MTERRWDPTSGEWRTFATHRQDRTFLPAADACPLCPGTPNGELDGPYDIAVFDNRFPSLTQLPPSPSVGGSDLQPVRPTEGAAEVVVYTSEHSLTLADLSVEHLTRLVDVWADRYSELARRPEVGYVFVFENRGEAIGVTLHHPHGQIYGYPDIPPRPLQELQSASSYMEEHGRCVWCDVVAHESADAVRVIGSNEHWLAYVPFAARFPYEVQLTALRHATSLLDLTDPERRSLASLLRTVVRGYDALFGFSLPYVMAMHQAPVDDGPWLGVSHLHVELTPIHRTKDKLKYLAGSELAAGAYINDTVPEETAAALRAVMA